ncbi:Chemotaxis protein CheY [Thalassocella blandensis]|nr:Chemotaxis protein CheY [Thalassocella blandensis]
MLDPKELKVVISTLTKRRAWIKKSLEDTSLTPAARKEHGDTLALLDSSIQKLAGAARVTHKPAAKSPAPPMMKTIPLERARVLVAEDNEESINLLVDILKDIGLKAIDVASDGIQAFDQIKKAEEPFNIILCDWEMPELSGIEVHSKAKASNTLRGAHFIMVTALSEAANIKKAVQQGVNDYIIKPIDMDVLEEKIRAALGLPPDKTTGEKAETAGSADSA